MQYVKHGVYIQARSRNHPLLLLSGVGANAIGYDLSPEVSLFITVHSDVVRGFGVCAIAFGKQQSMTNI